MEDWKDIRSREDGSKEVSRASRHLRSPLKPKASIYDFTFIFEDEVCKFLDIFAHARTKELTSQVSILAVGFAGLAAAAPSAISKRDNGVIQLNDHIFQGPNV